MPRVTYYHLQLRSGLHVGAQGIGLEDSLATVPSDTLFSALVAASLERHGAPGVWGAAFSDPQEAPFLLGSAFPYAGKVRFYPLPHLDLAALGLPEGIDIKALRRLRFISEGVWRRVVSGRSLADLSPAQGGGAFLQGGALWLAKDEIAALPGWMREMKRRGGQRSRPLEALPYLALCQVQRTPRVTIDRHSSASEIYYTGRVAFAPECGLWVPVAWLRPEAPFADGTPWRVAFEEALCVLGDLGLGGERSAGYGGFAWHAGGEEEWPQPAAGQPVVTLSRYHPRADELPAAFESSATRYQLVSVAGYLHSPGVASQRRRRLWLVAEGSVLTALPCRVMGDLTDVAPVVGNFPHPVWRYGLALPVPAEVAHA